MRRVRAMPPPRELVTLIDTIVTRRQHFTGRHRSIRPRTLHLVDLENLVAGVVTEQSVSAAWQEYRRVLGVRWNDHVVVSVSEKNALAAFLALPGTIQRVMGRNCPDGADLELIAAVDLGWAQTRFQQVVMASGDHIFTDLARDLSSRGIVVIQAIGASQTSWELYLACEMQMHLRGLQRHESDGLHPKVK